MSHWSSRELSGFLKRTENISVSHNYIARLWREHGLKPWRVDTFKVNIHVPGSGHAGLPTRA